jgi:hypothetical protein
MDDVVTEFLLVESRLELGKGMWEYYCLVCLRGLCVGLWLLGVNLTERGVPASFWIWSSKSCSDMVMKGKGGMEAR